MADGVSLRFVTLAGPTSDVLHPTLAERLRSNPRAGILGATFFVSQVTAFLQGLAEFSTKVLWPIIKFMLEKKHCETLPFLCLDLVKQSLMLSHLRQKLEWPQTVLQVSGTLLGEDPSKSDVLSSSSL